MTKTQQAIRSVAKYLWLLSKGAPFDKEQAQTMANLLWLCIPMKHRMDKAEIEATGYELGN